MNRTEIIFLIVAMAILLFCISKMPQYSFIFLFLLALAIIAILMSLFSKYSKKYENKKLSIMFCILGVILFVVYFVNSVYFDLTNRGSASDGLLLVTLFIITICLGWFFEENKD